MAFWKQALLSLAVLVLAALAWIRFFPGSHDVLEANGLGRIAAIVGPQQAEVAAAPQAPAAQAGGSGGGASGPQQAVVAAPVRREVINDRLTAIGTGRANQTVTVIPFASGRLDEVTVRSGERVDAGAVIARLDDDAERIARDRADVALADARQAFERVSTLRRANTASAVQLDEVQLAVRNAELALREAELNLERRAITAPVSGFVGILPIDTGNYVTTQTAVATIDDRSSILIDFWVPERFAGMIRLGSPLTAMLVSQGGDPIAGEVGALDNRIDEQSRTLRVQARIPNPDDRLRAGMSFRVEMRFPGDTYPAIDPLALQWGPDGAFVWAVDNGNARRVPVRVIQRNTQSVLVSADTLPEGTEVVTQGIHAVRDGAPVLLARNGAQPPAASGQGASTAASGS